MIAILKQGTTAEQTTFLIQYLEKQNIKVHTYPGNGVTVLGLIGDVSRVDTQLLRSMEMVSSVQRVSEPFKQVGRKFHPQDTTVQVGSAMFGGGHFALIAGPCSVESEAQIVDIARSVKSSGANVLRGGAFKPRTSPYAFQGMGEEGLRLLQIAKQEIGLPICTEIMDIRQLDLFTTVDLIQIGARNMQNFDLLKEIGKTQKPVLLKRGLSSTLEELLMSAEYIISEGNKNIILCERGIRTYETYTRNTLDLSAVPVLHELSHLPVVIDPSHATGRASLVPPMAIAAAAAGADGIMIEVHNNPACAMCDGPQSLTPAQFKELNQKVQGIREVLK